MSIRKIYYGWWVAACLLLATIMAYGIGISAFTLFIGPLYDEFGWNRATMGGIVSIFWIGAPLAPLIALLVEKYGCRPVLLCGVVLEGVCLMLVALVSSLGELYLLRALMGAGKVMVAVTLPITVSYWFSRKFGMVLAVVLSGAHIGGVIWPPLTQFLIESVGWRAATRYLGLLMLGTTTPLIIYLLRFRYPSTLGLEKDGIIHASSRTLIDEPVRHDRVAINGLSLNAALHMPVFWIILFVTFIFYLAYSGVLIHQPSYVSESGFSGQFAASVLSTTEFMALLAMLLFGYVLDRRQPGKILLLVMSIMACGVLLLVISGFYPNVTMMLLFGILFGAAMGGGDVTWVVVLRHYFGEKQFERIYGTWYFVSLATLFAAPIIIGFIYDRSGNYAVAFLTVLVAVMTGILLLLKMPARISAGSQ